MRCYQQLCLTGAPLAEAMLVVVEDFVFVKVFHDF